MLVNSASTRGCPLLQYVFCDFYEALYMEVGTGSWRSRNPMYSSAQSFSFFAGADSTQFYERFKLHKRGGIPYFWGIDFEDVLEFAAEG